MKINTFEPVLNQQDAEQKIMRFWDKLSPAWLSIWGPHIHHGYYENDENLTPEEAQIILIEKLLALINIPETHHILDVGCGMGSTSIYLAKKYSAEVTGITLSPKQVKMAQAFAKAETLSSVSFKLENALSMSSLADETFDIVWSLESCEQFYNKKLFLQQAYRVLKPGGRLMLATWCADKNFYEGEDAKKYLCLCHAFDLPYMPSLDYYEKVLAAEHFNIIKSEHWTEKVAKSWDVGISLLKPYRLFQQLKIGGFQGLRFVKQLKLMREAFKEDRIRYGVFCAEKIKMNA